MKHVFILLITSFIVTTACSNNNASSTTPTPVNRTTDTFNGTVQPKGADSHTFTVSQAGETDVTLTATTPNTTVVMGLAIGIPNGSACTPLPGATTTTAAGSIVQLSGTTSPGTLCVQVSDVGNLTAPVSYTVTALHP